MYSRITKYTEVYRDVEITIIEITNNGSKENQIHTSIWGKFLSFPILGDNKSKTILENKQAKIFIEDVKDYIDGYSNVDVFTPELFRKALYKYLGEIFYNLYASINTETKRADVVIKHLLNNYNKQTKTLNHDS